MASYGPGNEIEKSSQELIKVRPIKHQILKRNKA